MEKRGAKYHRERLGEALREEIETIVEGELGDPRIGLVERHQRGFGGGFALGASLCYAWMEMTKKPSARWKASRRGRLHPSRGGREFAPASSSGIVFSSGPLGPVRRQN